MTHPNLATIDEFFKAYGRRDFEALRHVTVEHVSWFFPGRNPASGIKSGLHEVLRFFDVMGAIMSQSNIQVEKLVNEANDSYVLECQHIWTRRADDLNLDQLWCVLWEFENGRIAVGRHFAADQYAVDAFFSGLMAPTQPGKTHANPASRPPSTISRTIQK